MNRECSCSHSLVLIRSCCLSQRATSRKAAHGRRRSHSRSSSGRNNPRTWSLCRSSACRRGATAGSCAGRTLRTRRVCCYCATCWRCLPAGVSRAAVRQDRGH
ncbi:hypothetical protein IEO21_05533 [Rhodonia placenta]|uniref:Uncharacterized protein n=1 Tax=Rhodonia placenta TaxID=104341 RepID=A0A8H7P236_9APHY|nr:hypothetical protein IEO21_05533 [Postia placenta]